MPNQPVNPGETEVDFVNLAKTIWKRKLLVVKLTGIAAVAGFLISIMIPNQYTASIAMVQEKSDPLITLSEERLSAISALASIAGVDLNGLSKATMSPLTYTNILSSIPFRQELIQTKLDFGDKDTATTLYDYYAKRRKNHPLISYTIGIPNRIADALKGSVSDQKSQTNNQTIPQLSREEIAINKILDKQIELQLLDDQNIVIRCTLPKPYAAAQLAQQTGMLLQKYLTDIQTAKPRSNLQYIQENHDEAKENFLKIQEELIAFQKSKKSSKSSELRSDVSIKSDEIQLSAAFRFAENAYSDLAKKLQQSKIALNQQTPIFRIVNPVAVPADKSSPNRIKITAIFTFFGFVLAIVLILGKGFFLDTVERWKNTPIKH